MSPFKTRFLLSFAVASLFLIAADGRLVFDLSKSDSSEESNVEPSEDQRFFSGWPFNSGKKADICDGNKVAF